MHRVLLQPTRRARWQALQAAADIMKTYDVVCQLTIRLEATDQGDAEIQALLMAQEHMFGFIIMDADNDEALRRVKELAEETGISIRVVSAEKVVTAEDLVV